MTRKGVFLKYIYCCLCILGTLIIGYSNSAVANEYIKAKDFVVPVRWDKFVSYRNVERNDLFDITAEILVNSVRYNLNWMPYAVEQVEKRTGDAHDIIRPSCSAVKAAAIVIKTGLFDQRKFGISKEIALKNIVNLIKVVTDAHKGASWWGKQSKWQGAWWASQLGQAGWLLWEDLPVELQSSLSEVVQYEANRLIEYKVPYWNGMGGNTKAEENAWNATILFTAVAMMPKHPNSKLWKNKCSELMVSSYAKKSDLNNDIFIDGKKVKAWLNGFNANEDGSVDNHNHVGHPSYTARIQVILESFCVQPLSGQLVPEAADFNVQSTYEWLANNIYIKGQPQVLDHDWDWTRKFYYLYFCLDTQVYLLGLDKNSSFKGKDGMILRANAILDMQMRHPDGHSFELNETKWPQGFEQDLSMTISNAYLHFWLDLQGKVRQGNWLN